MSEKMVNLPNLETSSLEKKLQKELECPICLNIPRKLPIPCCPAGHIMCSSCRKGVQTCPTCRRQLGDNTSSLAAAMIENVNHNCNKYAEHGCSRQDKPTALGIHEARCAERTIRCPKPFGFGCGRMIPIKKFLAHVIQEHNCNTTLICHPIEFLLTSTDIRWDGVAVRKGKEFDCENNLNWHFQHINKNSNNFLFSSNYYAKEKLFLFFVMVHGDSEEAKRFSASIKLVNDEKDIIMYFQGPVLPLDNVPGNEELMMDSPGCFKVHYLAMRDIFTVVEKARNMCRVKFELDIEVDIV